ncbi:MAG: hypothetical protein HYT76_06720 [Deltaproteobacteria bacterium]|nr:hypothetical protein [Deltaproteobacteria bacterium]
MPRMPLKKERWTITFDHALKSRVQEEADKLRIYPVQLLESLVREKLNPYGFQSIRDSIHYVHSIREMSAARTDKTFLAELRKWQKN